MPPTPLALLRATVRLFVGSEGSQPLPTRWWIAPFIVVLMAVAFVLSSIAADEEFPVDIGRAVGLFIDEIVDWLTENVSWFFQAIKDVLTWFLVALEDALFWMPWPAFIVTITLTAWLLVSFRMAIFSVAALLLVGAFGLWESTMETVALIVVTVALSILVAVPMGVWASQNDRLDTLVRPILRRDADDAELRLPRARDRVLQPRQRPGGHRHPDLRGAARRAPDQPGHPPAAGGRRWRRPNRSGPPPCSCC